MTVLTRGRTPVPAPYRSVVADRKDAASMRAAVAGVRADVVVNFLGYEVSDLAVDCEVFADRVRQYIFISSAAAYTKPVPRLPITEEMPLGNPLWEYAQKKADCEAWLREYAGRTGFPFTIVRPSHTYSNHWVPNVVSSSGYTLAARMEQGKPVFVPGDGENPWTLTAASDFAAGLAGLTGNEKAIGEAFHITSDEVLTWNRIYAETAAAAGISDPVIEKIPVPFICEHAPHLRGTVQGDKANPGIFDNSKIRKFVPGFQCTIPFREGVRRAVDWMRAHPEDRKINPDADRTFDTVISAWRSRSA